MKLDVTRGDALQSQVSGVEPPLKWVGGKRWLAPRVRALFPERITGRYYEPFFGGGAVFFSMRPDQLPMFPELGRQHVAAQRARVADLSTDLVNFYLRLRDSVEPVINEVRHLRHAYLSRRFCDDNVDRRRKTFDSVRAEYNEVRREPFPSLLCGNRQAARYLLLNKTCFNGLMRFNRKGEFNTPHGDYKNPSIFDAGHLRAVSRALRGVDVKVQDFEECVADAGPGDVVYLDPPHAARTSKRSGTFTSYTDRPWTEEDDGRVTRVFWDLARRGARVVVSQADTERARELLLASENRRGQWLTVEPVSRPERVNSKGSGRASVGEILVAAGPR